jgi:hypothetical protein
MNERRYTDDEIADIFAHAAERGVTPPTAPANSGLTLVELQRIAGEVGLEPEAVAVAAARLNRPAAMSRQPAAVTGRHFWLPVEIGRTVELPQRLTDAEWQDLVADLQTTFEARGKTEETDSARKWTGGGARAVLTRTAAGETLQLRSFRRQGVVMLWTAVVSFNVALVAFFFPVVGIDILGTNDDNTLIRVATFAAIAGLGIVAATAQRLKSWARLGRQQMDNVVMRLFGSR